jgi:cysteine desulfurase
MEPFLTSAFGNAASRTHRFGWEAQDAIEEARAKVAALIKSTPGTIVFTSGATESDNLAVKGAVWGSGQARPHVITAATEHPAILEPLEFLADRGQARVTVLPVGTDGQVDPQAVADAIRPDTILVTIMAANNETGVLHPIEEIAKICAREGVLFHTDATQMAGKLPLDLPKLGVSMASLSAHKMYGPKGVGALYVADENVEKRLVPLLHGGGHEGGLRSGTPAVPLLAGIGAAAAVALQEMPNEIPRIQGLRKQLGAYLLGRIPDTKLNGNAVRRLPGNLNVCFNGVEGECLLNSLDGVALSTGSACGSDKVRPSHVLTAMGLRPEECHSSIRFGIGRFNTKDEIDSVCQMIGQAVADQRRR